MPDDAAFHRNRPSARISTGWWCAECKEASDLSDLNSGMLCASCGQPDEDPEDFIDLSDAAMLAAHGTWRL